MKKIIFALLIIMATSFQASASDSVALGVRIGAVADQSSFITEAFGDLYLNKLISVGGTLGYQVLDRDDKKSIKRDESVPVTVLAKLHAPLPILSPYLGLGEAIVFHDKRTATGSPVAIAGLDFKPMPLPLFVNLEYRHQLNGELNILAGGIGIKF